LIFIAESPKECQHWVDLVKSVVADLEAYKQQGNHQYHHIIRLHTHTLHVIGLTEREDMAAGVTPPSSAPSTPNPNGTKKPGWSLFNKKT
jgi:hypothetical protein